MDEHVEQQNIESVEDQIDEIEVDTADEEAEAASIGSIYEDEEAESDDDADATEDADDEDVDEDEGEDDEEQEEAVEPEPDPEPEPEPVETEENRRNRRLASEFLKLAKSRGYNSVEEMLAEETGGSVKDIEARVSSEEMTDEEKIAAYDKMMSAKNAADRQKAGKAVHDRLLSEIHREFPETVGTLKNLDNVPNAERFRELVLKKGLSGDEAYAICAAKVIRAKAAKAAKPSGKEHIRPDSRKASGNAGTMSSSEMSQFREMFPDMSDAQIRKMYARTTK